MILKVFKDDVLDGLHKAANIIPAKTGAAYLRSIWIKADGVLSVMATDSNIEFAGNYQAEIEEPGLAGVQGRAFYDLVRKLPPGQITLKLDEENRNLLIQQGRRKYQLPTNDPTWFQNFSKFPDEGGRIWSGDYLQELIERIAYCIADEDAMEAIACLSIQAGDGEGDVEVCGLNGHQFAMLTFTNEDIRSMLPDEGLLIHKKYLLELKKWLTTQEVELAIANKRLYFKSGEGRETFSLPLSYYAYPDYHNFLNKLSDPQSSVRQIDKQELMDGLDRLVIFNTETNRGANFDLGLNDLTLTAQGQETGSATESLECSYKGGLKRIVFPTRNLIEVLGHFSSKKVAFTFTGGEGPCGLTGGDDLRYNVIIMPMKIMEETYYSEEEA